MTLAMRTGQYRQQRNLETAVTSDDDRAARMDLDARGGGDRLDEIPPCVRLRAGPGHVFRHSLPTLRHIHHRARRLDLRRPVRRVIA